MTISGLTRRSLLGASFIGVFGAYPAHTPAQTRGPLPFAYPIGDPGKLPGDGFLIRVGYACENLTDYPNWWHTGENWHRLEGETGGAPVLAAAAGEVVFAGYDYPGPVVIIRHGPDLFTQYGHLDDRLAVAVGDQVARGQQLGTVLTRTDKPGHLHFEVRTFFQTAIVNGTTPSHGVSCGYDCPPGPGYWPIAAPEHLSDLGWRNPVHALARRAFPDGVPAGTEVAVAAGAPAEIPLWATPSANNAGISVGTLPGRPGDRYPLRAVAVGEEAATGTSAEATQLWYRLALPDGESAWAAAAIPSDAYVGADGRPATVRIVLLPVIE